MKEHKRSIIIIVLILILTIFNLVSIYEKYNYIEIRAEQGNNRWKEVEGRLLDMESKIENLEKELVNDGGNS